MVLKSQVLPDIMQLDSSTARNLGLGPKTAPSPTVKEQFVTTSPQGSSKQYCAPSCGHAQPMAMRHGRSRAQIDKRPVGRPVKKGYAARLLVLQYVLLTSYSTPRFR